MNLSLNFNLNKAIELLNNRIYPLTDPAVNPPVICFWKKINNAAIGVAAMTEDAAITPQSALKSSIKTVLMPTATVHKFLSLRKIAASMKSE